MAELILKTKNGTKGIVIVGLSCRTPLLRDETFINFSKSFNNKSYTWIEEKIKEIWSEKCQKNSRLFNQSKFRFASATCFDVNKVVLDLGLTSYMDLMGTNCHAFGKELATYGAEQFQNCQACLADPLGVGSLLLTSDNKFVFLKRALWTGEDEGKLDRPGGHPEPVSVSSTIESWTEDECCNSENLVKIRDEIFDSVKHEIRDEVNLPLESLSDPLFLGMVRSLERLGRPTAEFLVLCSLTSKEVEVLYSQNSQSEADESVGIVCFPEEDIREQRLEPSVWKSLTDASCGAIELYGRYYSKCPNTNKEV